MLTERYRSFPPQGGIQIEQLPWYGALFILYGSGTLPVLDSESIPVSHIVKAMKLRFDSELSKMRENPVKEHAILLVGYKDAIVDLAYDLLPSKEFLEMGGYLNRFDAEIDKIRE